MARTFDNVDDVIIAGIGGANATFGTIAAIVRRTTDGAIDTILNLRTSGSVAALGMGANVANELTLLRGAADYRSAAGVTITSAMGWCFVAVNKATGNVLPRFHTYRYDTGAWQHVDGAVLCTDAASAAGGAVCFGAEAGTSNWWPGDLLVAGVWNTKLTDQEIETLPFCLEHWRTTGGGNGPLGLWLFNQHSTATAVIDETGGGANQTSITGTAIATVSVPLFSHFGLHHLENSGVVQVIASDVPTAVRSNPGSRRAVSLRRRWRRWGTVTSDSFNRIMGETPAGLGRADTSLETTRHVWEEAAQGGAPAPTPPYWKINDGTAVLRKQAPSAHLYTWQQSGLADCRVLVTLVPGSTITSPGFGLYLRGAAEGTALLLTVTSTTTFQWSTLVGATVTSLMTVTSPVTLVAGTRYRLEVHLRGSRVRAYLDNVQMGADQWFNVYQTETRHGLYCYQDAVHAFDDFRVYRG